jgi:hypothetical protein
MVIIQMIQLMSVSFCRSRSSGQGQFTPEKQTMFLGVGRQVNEGAAASGEDDLRGMLKPNAVVVFACQSTAPLKITPGAPSGRWG